MHIPLILVVFSWACCSISYSIGSFCRKCLMQAATLEGAGWDDWHNCSPCEHSFIFLPESSYAQNKWDFWPWSEATISRPCSASQNRLNSGWVGEMFHSWWTARVSPLTVIYCILKNFRKNAGCTVNHCVSRLSLLTSLQFNDFQMRWTISPVMPSYHA